MELHPECNSFFLREAALALQGTMSVPLNFEKNSPSSPDVATSNDVKSGTCKKCGPAAYQIETGVHVPRSPPQIQKKATTSVALPAEIASRLVRSTQQAGRLVASGALASSTAPRSRGSRTGDALPQHATAK